MDFEEWLWANGIKPMHIDYLRKCLDNVSPVDVSIHARFRELLNKYVIVGGMPDDGNRIQSEFKVYMSDIGLLVSMLEDGTQSSILRGELYGYKGAIFENLVADILGKMGRKLYYYHKNGGIELDFLMRHKGQCVPIECKATTGNAKSMRTVLGHPEKYHVDFAIKLGDYNVGMKDKLLTLPMYMAFLLNEV